MYMTGLLDIKTYGSVLTPDKSCVNMNASEMHDTPGFIQDY